MLQNHCRVYGNVKGRGSALWRPEWVAGCATSAAGLRPATSPQSPAAADAASCSLSFLFLSVSLFFIPLPQFCFPLFYTLGQLVFPPLSFISYEPQVIENLLHFMKNFCVLLFFKFHPGGHSLLLSLMVILPLLCSVLILLCYPTRCPWRVWVWLGQGGKSAVSVLCKQKMFPHPVAGRHLGVQAHSPYGDTQHPEWPIRAFHRNNVNRRMASKRIQINLLLKICCQKELNTF